MKTAHIEMYRVLFLKAPQSQSPVAPGDGSKKMVRKKKEKKVPFVIEMLFFLTSLVVATKKKDQKRSEQEAGGCKRANHGVKVRTHQQRLL